ncbi:HET-domain-containing protein [Hypoxylon sp. NC1633]|nr:HET-domain-containing protein [Hypoxylon sp. NC1633]
MAASQPIPTVPSLYSPLDPLRKEIRLLECLPGRETDIVRANLLHASLLDSEAARYETISYYWGDASIRDTLEVNGQVISVPSSSAAALRCMRNEDVCRNLWIDAICINQQYDDERGKQVSMMAEIYSSSQRNLIYLGEAVETTVMGLQSMYRLLEEIEKKTDGFSNLAKYLDKLWMNRQFGESIECSFDEDAVCMLFDRPWFKRLWIVQEAVLAPSSLCFYGSRVQTDLASLLRVATWLWYHRDFLRKKTRFVDYIYPVTLLWFEAERHHTERRMTALIILAGAREATESRDKIFAIVGLLPKPSGLSGTHPDPALTAIDYTKPVGHVYRDAYRYSIQERNDLHILQIPRRFHGDGVRVADFPSWVPRVIFPEYDNTIQHPTNYCKFSADDGRRMHSDMTRVDYSGPDTLCLAGYCATRISWVSDLLMFPLSGTMQKFRETLRSILDMYRQIIEEDPGANDELHANRETTNPLVPVPLALALMGGVNLDFNRASADHVLRVCEILNGLLNSPEQFILGVCSTENTKTEYVNTAALCSNRRFFFGPNGTFGLVSSWVRPGDYIYVVFGSGVPFALRRVKDGSGSSAFLWLGPAYAQGAMDGEVVNHNEEKGIEPEVVKLI